MYRHIAIAAASTLGLILVPMGCHQLSISVDKNTADAQVSPFIAKEVNNPQSTIPEVNPSNTNKKLLAQSTIPEKESVTSPKAGLLRISNQTKIPIRLAFLGRNSKENSKNNTKSNIPAHWDFAPEEGSTKGLILSLPQGKLNLKLGDILVAFAEDGSRRYWGPFVVGESSEPLWDGEKNEWKLILQ